MDRGTHREVVVALEQAVWPPRVAHSGHAVDEVVSKLKGCGLLDFCDKAGAAKVQGVLASCSPPLKLALGDLRASKAQEGPAKDVVETYGQMISKDEVQLPRLTILHTSSPSGPPRLNDMSHFRDKSLFGKCR